MKDYSKMSAFELIEESDKLLQLQSESLEEIADNIDLVYTKTKEYHLLLLKCSAWIEYITNFVDLTDVTYKELSKLLSEINYTLGERLNV